MRDQIFLKYDHTSNGMCTVYYKFDYADSGKMYRMYYGIQDGIDEIALYAATKDEPHWELDHKIELDNIDRIYYPELPKSDSDTDKIVKDWLLKQHPYYKPYKNFQKK